MLEDIQRLKVKDLICSNSEATDRIKADMVLKVYTILVRHVLRLGENQQQCSDNTAQDPQNTTENGGDLHQFPELNFIQLYDYLIVSTQVPPHCAQGNKL